MNDNPPDGTSSVSGACSGSPVDPATELAGRAWQAAPLGCTAPAEEVRGIVRLLAELAGASSAAPERTASGYALRLPLSRELERRAGEFLSRDKACCPFLEFELGRDGRELHLQVSGPEGAAMVLDLSFEVCRVAAEHGIGPNE